MTALEWLEIFVKMETWDNSEDVENKTEEYSSAIERMEYMMKLLKQMDAEEQAKVAYFLEQGGPRKLDKRTLTVATMAQFGIQFEPAEHIVEVAIGDKDLDELSLAEVTALVMEVGNSLVKE